MSDNKGVIQSVDLATGDSDSNVVIMHDNKVRITINLRTGGLVLDDDFTVDENARIFWQAVHDFVHPKPGVSIPTKKTTVTKLKLDMPKNDRLETGPVQFNNDWPGLFIDGADAGGYGLHLEQLLENPIEFEKKAIAKALLQRLVTALKSCRT